MSTPAQTPDPPYFAVIFTSRRTAVDDGYGDTSEQMLALASQQPGFLGYESARGADGLGITISYWQSEEAIANWRRHADHLVVQQKGREQWYSEFVTRVARVERARRFAK